VGTITDFFPAKFPTAKIHISYYIYCLS